MRFSKNKSRGNNWSKITTTKLKEILNSNYCTGIDGADYEMVKDELLEELYTRQNKQLEKDLKRYEIDSQKCPQDYWDKIEENREMEILQDVPF